MTRAFEGAPAVSVVVPLYNVPEKYFSACIGHLCAQTLSDIEIVVVDDGSTSGVEKLADEFAEKDERIRVFHRENGGVSAARNFGISQARGEYISFLDADDWIDDGILKKAYELAEKDGLDVVAWGVVREYGDRAVKYPFSGFLHTDEVCRGEAILKFREAVLDCSALGASFARLVRRDLLIGDKIFFDEELLNYTEDIEWNSRLFGKVRSALLLEESAHHYVYNPASLTSQVTREKAQCALRSFEKIRAGFAGDVSEEELTGFAEKWFCSMLASIAISGFFHPKNAMRYSEKKRAFKAYVAQDEVKATLRSPGRKRLSFAQRTVIFCMRHHWCFALRILASVRYREKKAA